MFGINNLIAIILMIGFDALAMDITHDISKEVNDQFFSNKKNSLNQKSWDLSGVNIEGQIFYIIWVPNAMAYKDLYDQCGLLLQDKESRNKAWIRARLPAQWSVETKNSDRGTFRVIKDKRGRKKLGIFHYLVMDQENKLVSETRVLRFNRKKVEN